MAQTELEEMVVRLTAEARGYMRDIKEAQALTESFGATANTLIRTMGALGVSFSSLNFAKGGITLAAEAEKMQISFSTMLGSAQKARDLVGDLQKYAADTPLNTGDLQRASKTLLQFGVTAEDLMPTLKRLGDVTGGDSETFGRMSLAFGQMTATGRLMGQDLLQFINAGFNPLKEMSRTTGKTMGQLKHEMEEGKIGVNEVTKAFKTATSAGGAFNDLMKKQSQSLTGLASTLQDDFGAFQRSVGQDLVKQFDLKNLAKETSAALQGVTDWWRQLSPAIKDTASAGGIAGAGFVGLVGTAGLLKFALGGIVTSSVSVVTGVYGYVSAMNAATVATNLFRTAAVGGASYGIYKVADAFLQERRDVMKLNEELNKGAALQARHVFGENKAAAAFLKNMPENNVEAQRKSLRDQLATIEKNINGPMGQRKALEDAQKNLGEQKGGIWGNMQDVLGWNPLANQARQQVQEMAENLKNAEDQAGILRERLSQIDDKQLVKKLTEDAQALNYELNKEAAVMGLSKHAAEAYRLVQQGLSGELKENLYAHVRYNEEQERAVANTKELKDMMGHLSDEIVAVRGHVGDGDILKFVNKGGVGMEDIEKFKQAVNRHDELEGFQATRKYMTPLQAAAEEQGRLNMLFEDGRIGAQTYSRGLMEVTKNLVEFHSVTQQLNGAGAGSAAYFANLADYSRTTDQPRAIQSRMAELQANPRSGLSSLGGGLPQGGGKSSAEKVLEQIRDEMRAERKQKRTIEMKAANLNNP